MRKRFLRIATAALMSVALALPFGARPVYAAVDWTAIVKYAVDALKSWKDVNDLKKSLDQAKQEILTALNTVKVELLAQMDRIATAEARACATQIVTVAPGLDSLNPDVLQSFALDAVGCVTRIDSLIGTVTDKASNDQLGLAMNTTVPLTQLALRKANITNVDLLPLVARSDAKLVPMLEPPCTISSPWLDPEVPRPHRGDIVGWDIFCTAYNNDFGGNWEYQPWPQGPSAAAIAVAQNEATRNTSRAIAQAILPVIQP